MGVFLLRRFAVFVATLIGASLVIFLLLEILPGNAALTILGADASPDAVAALTRKLGLDQPAAAALRRMDIGPPHGRSRHQLRLFDARLAS